MFHGSRWASVFVNVLGENAETGFSCLKVIVPPVKTIPGPLFGHSVSRRLEKLLRESVAACGGGFPGAAAEFVIRFVALLVEKNHFGEIDLVMRNIEELLDRKKGVLAVTVESAAPMDEVFANGLRRRIAECTGTAEIKMKTELVPDLLGGYLLRIGGYYIDASLKGQMEKLKAELEAAAVSAPGGGA